MLHFMLSKIFFEGLLVIYPGIAAVVWHSHKFWAGHILIMA